MTTTTYRLNKGERGYIVTDGIWESAAYKTKATARKVMADAQWGEKGLDGRGTHANERVE